MNHPQQHLSEYADAMLDETKRKEVADHLHHYPDCRRELDELKAVSRLLKGLPRKNLPAGFISRLKTVGTPPPLLGRTLGTWDFALKSLVFALPCLLVAVVLRDRIRSFFLVSPPYDSSKVVLYDEPHYENRSRARGPASVRVESFTSEAPVQETPPPVPPAEPTRRFPMGVLTSGNPPPAPMTLPIAVLPPQDAGGLAAGAPEELQSQETPPPPAQELPIEPQVTAHVLDSEAERIEFWAANKMRLSPPRVDYSKKRLVVVLSTGGRWAVEIRDVRRLPDKTIVRYRQTELPESTPPSVAVYQFRVITRDELPIEFELLED